MGWDTTFELDANGSTPGAAEEVDLTGTVAIAGKAKVDTELTAIVQDTNAPEGTTFTYLWDGQAAVKNAATYTPVEADVGNELTCTITAAGYIGSISAKTAAVEAKYTKADLSAAIDAATAKMNAIPKSADGSDVSTWDKWALEADITTFSTAITAAQAIVDKADAAAAEIVTGYETLAAASTAFDGACKMGTKAPITVEIPKVGEEAAPGEVTFKNAAGAAITDWTAIQPNDLVVLQANPKDGYYFVKWVNKKASGSDSASVETFSVDGTAKEYKTNPLTVSASEAIELQAVFGSSADISVATGDPAVGNLLPTLTTKNAERGAHAPVLVGADGTEGFKADVKNYDMYLLTGETGLSFQPLFDSTKYSMTIGGTAVTIPDAEKPNVGAVTAVTVTDGTAIEVVIKEKTGTAPKSTTYTIMPHVAKADPKIHIELEQDETNKKLVKATAKLSEAQVKAGQFTVKLDTTLEAAKQFAGFSDKAGTVLAADKELVADTDYVLSADDLTVTEANYNHTDKTVTVAFEAKDNGIASYDKEKDTLTFYLAKTNESDKLADVLDSLKVDAAANEKNTMFDDRYKTLLDDGKNVKETSLVYITAKSSVVIYQYLQGASGSDLATHPITFDVYAYDTETDTVGDKLNTEAVELNDATIGELKYDLEAGEYQMNLKRDGYLTAKVRVTADPTKDEVLVLGGFTMVAGELTGDDKIDANDRTKLLTVFNQTATNGAAGTGENAVYADFDDSGRVNAIDLGRLLQNYTK